MSKFKKNILGFTLLELLIAVGVLAIVSAVAVVIINPIEKLKESRDAVRIVNLANINDNLDLFADENPSTNMGQINTVYVSLPSNQANCSDLSLPGLPSGWTYACKPLADYRKVDGTGWIPVDFTRVTGYSLVSLPIDPKNNNIYYYAYVTGGSWSLSSLLESEKRLKEVATKDQGTDDGRYEIGSDLTLWSEVSGLVGYWKFDEISGISAYDSSGKGNTGTLNLASGSSWVTSGKINGGIYLNQGDGGGAPNDVVVVPDSSLLDMDVSKSFTIDFWVKPANYVCTAIMREDNQFEIYRCSGAGGGITIRVYLPSSTDYTGSIPITDGQWSSIVVVYDKSSTTLKMYVNNVVAGTWTVSGTPAATNSALGIGAYPNGYYSFKGTIDEVRFYNRTLSASEIQSLYNATK